MPDLPSMLHDLVERSVPALDVDVIVATGRRSRRRRRARIGSSLVAVLLVGGIVGGIVAVNRARSGPGPRGPRIAVGGGTIAEVDATRTALAQLTIVSPGGGSGALSGGSPGPIDLTDPVSGRTTSRAFPVGNVQSTSYPFLTLGSNVVIVLNSQTGPFDPSIGTVYVASSTFEQWHSIGPASYALAALDPDAVWLVSDNATPDQRLHGTEYGTRRTVGEVRLEGSHLTNDFTLTDRRSPIAAVAGGLLTSRPGATTSSPTVYEVWDPAHNRVVRRLDVGNVPIATSSTHVVWTASSCEPDTADCPEHVTDVRTGTDRIVRPPSGMIWEAGAFSPDGTRLALIARRRPTRAEITQRGPIVPSGTVPAAIVVVDIATGRTTPYAVSTWTGAPSPSWSPDGSLVFIVRDRTHVEYVNAVYPKAPVHELAVPGADAYLVVGHAPAPPAGQQRYAYDGLVSQDAQHSAELCIYATYADLVPGSDSCSGPVVVGLDWSAVKGRTVGAGGVISGRLHLVGTDDGAASTFTLTQPPGPAGRSGGAVTLAPPLPARSTCAAPPGGWHTVDPARVTFDDYLAVTNTARASPDFAGLWFAPGMRPGGAGNYGDALINVAYTRNLDAHRRELAAIWGGPVCVVGRPHSYAELQRIVASLIGPAGPELGLQITSAGPDDVTDTVHAEAVAANAASQLALDRRFGPGVVRLQTRLRPVS